MVIISFKNVDLIRGRSRLVPADFVYNTVGANQQSVTLSLIVFEDNDGKEVAEEGKLEDKSSRV